MFQRDDLDRLNPTDEATSRNVSTRSDQPAVVWPRPPAINDPRYEEPAIARDDLGVWARRAFASNGFGDGGFGELAIPERPTSYDLHHHARSHRSFRFGEIIMAVFDAIVTAIFAVRAVDTRHPKV